MEAPVLSTGWVWAAAGVALSTLGLLLSVLVLTFKQGRSEGRMNQAMAGMADAIGKSCKDIDELWEHQRRQDTHCRDQVIKNSEAMGQMHANLALLPGIAASVESLRKETKDDIKQLRDELRGK